MNAAVGRRTSLSRIDLWVAATMPPAPALERWLAEAGVSTTDAHAVLRESDALSFRDHLVSRPDRVTDFFGPPDAVRPHCLLYDLALLPAHQFVWAVSRWGDASALGLRLRELAALPRLAERTVDAARATFRPWHHTEHEVRCAMGDPDRVLGGRTPRSQRWVYAGPRGSRALRFDFGWGLLYELGVG